MNDSLFCADRSAEVVAALARADRARTAPGPRPGQALAAGAARGCDLTALRCAAISH
jgi:hypothetical protein